MPTNTHPFMILVYARRHDLLSLEGQATHLNPCFAHKQTIKTAKLLKKPASSIRTCAIPACNVVS